MNSVLRGKLSRYTNESKFISNINTRVLARQAIEEGNSLRELITGKRIIEEKISWHLKNAYRL